MIIHFQLFKSYSSRKKTPTVETKKAARPSSCDPNIIRDPAGIRTQDHYIKSVMLYQLSYGIIALFSKAGANIDLFLFQC